MELNEIIKSCEFISQIMVRRETAYLGLSLSVFFITKKDISGVSTKRLFGLKKITTQNNKNDSNLNQ